MSLFTLMPVSVLITVALQYVLKWGTMRPTILFIFKTVLAIGPNAISHEFDD